METLWKKYDHRADIYSLGMVMYWLLNRQHLPFLGEGISRSETVTMRLAGEKLPELTGINPELAKIIQKACAFKPEDRYQSARDLVKALQKLQIASGSEREVPGYSRRHISWKTVCIAAFVLIAIAATVIVAGRFDSHKNEEAASASTSSISEQITTTTPTTTTNYSANPIQTSTSNPDPVSMQTQIPVPTLQPGQNPTSGNSDNAYYADDMHEEITIAIPNDPTNEGRALLLQAQGLIKLKAGVGLTATIADIEENKFGLTFNETEVANVLNVLVDSDYAILNSHYALNAGLGKALLYENSESPYVNVVCVNEANKDSDQAKALAAALLSQQVADYFAETYKDGSAIATIDNPTDGYDASVNYDALKGETIKVACTLDPHSYVLEVAKKILAEKEITLEIVVVDDYVTPNTMVDAGDVFANYFAHQPYQDDFNAQNNTKLVTIAGVHVEPMGLYAGKQTDLSILGIETE